MSRRTGQYDPFCDVIIEDVRTESGIPVGKAVTINNMGQLEAVGTVSDGYSLVSNKDAHEGFISLLNDSGFDVHVAEDRITSNGRQFRAVYSIESDQLNRYIIPGARMIGDVINIEAIGINSYDGTKKRSLSISARVLSCLNGMCITKMLGSIEIKHYGMLGDLDLTKQMNDERNAFRDRMARVNGIMTHQVLPSIDRMGQVNTDAMFFRNLINATNIPNNLLNDAILAMEGVTAWDTYNGFTAVLSRNNSIRADDMNRKVSEFYFDAFSG